MTDLYSSLELSVGFDTILILQNSLLCVVKIIFAINQFQKNAELTYTENNSIKRNLLTTKTILFTIYRQKDNMPYSKF